MFCVTPLVKFHLVVGQAIYVLVVFLLLQNVIIDALVAYVRKTIKKKKKVFPDVSCMAKSWLFYLLDGFYIFPGAVKDSNIV